MNVKGTLIVKGDTQIITEKFSKREFVIETKEKWPQKILLQLTQENCELLDFWNVGEYIDADFNLRGREWNAPDGKIKYFNTLEAWRLGKDNTVKNSTKDGIEKNFTEDKLQAEQNELKDDLPF